MKSLLVVVDYQNDFVTGSLGFKEAIVIYPNIINLIKEFENKNDDIVFTRDLHEENYLNTLEGKYLPIKHCIKNTEGCLFYKEIEDISKNHIIINKSTFPGVDLIKVLEGKEYKSIIICGVVTNICVISNAILLKSIFPNTPIYINKKACASNNKDLEDKTYDILRNLQFEIIE